MPATFTDRLNGLTTSVAVKPPCVAVASSNITLAGLQTIGAVTVAQDDRVLLIGQTDTTENGIYTADSGDWTRAKDFDGARDAVQGTLVLVRNQFIEGAFYEVTTANPIRIGSSSVTFRLRDSPNVTYDLTQAEIDEGVTPLNYAYRTGNAFRYMSAAQIADVSSNTGAVDVTTALNNCTISNRGYSVFLPFGTYLITASINVYNQLIDGEHKERTIIKPSGNIKAFMNTGVEFITGHIRNLTVRYNNGVQPTNAGTSSNQIAIYFTAVSGKSPNFFDISDVLVQGAWWAYYDDSGSYAGTLERVFAEECQKGFYKINGTTFHFKECITLNVNEPFNMNHHQGLVMTSCANDGAVIPTANTANLFDDCAGLVINGWDSESNALTGQNSTLFTFTNCQGQFNGWTGHANTQAAAGGENTQIMKVDGGAMLITAARPIFLAGDLTFTGAGSVFTLLAVNAAKVTVTGGDMSAATGGAPATRNCMVATGTARIQYLGVTFTSGTIGANVYELQTSDFSGTVTMTGATGAGTTGTAVFTYNNGVVTMTSPDLTGTSNATTCTITGISAISSLLVPTRTQQFIGRVQDNGGARTVGFLQVLTSGVINVFPTVVAGAWTAANAKSVDGFTFNWMVR